MGTPAADELSLMVSVVTRAKDDGAVGYVGFGKLGVALRGGGRDSDAMVPKSLWDIWYLQR